VHDGDRIAIPHRGVPVPTVAPGVQEASPPAIVDTPQGPTSADASKPPGPLDLNTATAEQLDTLPGVGPATAQRILDFRTKRGRIRSVTELLDVPGIGEAKLAALRSRVRV
jgi:competence protein ComEA